jgi:hypothetical protein
LGSHLEQANEYLSQIHQQQHSWEDYTCPWHGTKSNLCCLASDWVHELIFLSLL